MRFEQKMPDIGKTVLVHMVRNGEKNVDLAALAHYTQGKHKGEYVWVIHNTVKEIPAKPKDRWWRIDHLLSEED